MKKKSRLKTIVVFLGVFLIFTGLATHPNITKGKKTEAVASDNTISNSKDQISQEVAKATKSKILVEDPANMLVLVNKEHILSANYIPPDLVKPKIPFSFSDDSPKRLLREEAAKALEQLFAKAEDDKIEIAGVSGYRSYETQKAIFASNVERRGEEEANKISARPGESEHQTGLAIDVSSSSVDYRLVDNFGETEEGKWLALNAPKFGFIIRYAKDKTEVTGYIYEPWHIRYIGVQAAKEITEQGVTLEEYILNKR